MADIELVFKIPKELYELYKGRPPMLGDAGMDMIAQSIANGTLLPKGHGRLIDADAFERRCMFDSDIEDMQDVIYALRDFKPVIEADKADNKPTCGDCKEWGTVNCPETYKEPTENDDICDCFKADKEGK